MSADLDLRGYRREYEARGLDVAQTAADPFSQFARWFADVERAGVEEPNAAVLATADVDARPSARHVLIKQVDQDGFVFYSNATSRKGHQLAENPRAALCTAWSAVGRQVIAEGAVVPVDGQTADRYFADRPRGSQIAAWASDQSSTVGDRAALEARVAELERSLEEPVARPPHWWGYRLVPDRVEFWQGRRDRLHDRILYRGNDGRWTRERLAP